MASGDTIPASIRLTRFDSEGNENRVAGDYPSDAIDDENQSLSQDQKLYINTMHSSRRSAPLQATRESAPDAQFFPGEELRLKAQSYSDNARSINVGADVFEVQLIERDMNRGTLNPRTLSQNDQELSSNPAESDSQYVEYFRATVPDRTEWRIVGSLVGPPIEV